MGGLKADVTIQPHIPCEEQLYAETDIVCGGVSPYTYQWYKSSNGITFIPISGETNSTLAYTINPQNLIPRAWFFNCEITDGGNNTITVHTCIPVKPCPTNFLRRKNITSFSRPGSETKVSISPNPASDNLLISIESQLTLPFKIEIYDTFGKCIFKKENTTMNSDLHLEKLDIQNLSSGMYVFKYTNSIDSKVLPITINH